MNNKTKISILVVISSIIVTIVLVFLSNPVSDIMTEELPTITVTGKLSCWQPYDGPGCAIIPDENLVFPMDNGKIYLYGDWDSEHLVGKQVKVTGKIVENYEEYKIAKHGGGSVGGDPRTSVIFVTDVEEMTVSSCMFDPENPDAECNDA